MANKGEQLNKRVWTLFREAGFTTKPGPQSPTDEEVVILPGGGRRTLDLSASVSELDVKIIGENTTTTQFKESFSTYVHDFQELMRIARADAGLFVLTGKEVSDKDRLFAKQRGIGVWGEEELQYYEAVVEAIGEYAKYEIIHSLGITTHEEKAVHHVLALRFRQPYSDSSVDLLLFTITPEKLLKTCAIYRRAQGSGQAYQRMLRRDRLRSVRKFVTQEDALLPPNIIVHFGQKVTWDSVKVPEVDAGGKPVTLAREGDCELVVLKIPMEYASLELIDGQHRLYGFVRAEPATKGNFNLVALGIAGLPIEMRRDMFVAINDKSRRMDPNLVAYLRHTTDEIECQENNELMAIRIVVELNKSDPFKNRIRLLDVGDQKITLKGFSGYDLKGLLGQRGLLRKHYPHESKAYVNALRLYFGVLNDMFREEWLHPERYIIFTNRGISAFLKLLKSILKTCECSLDEEIVRRYLQPLKDKSSNWETSKLKSAYVGSKGWKDFHHDLVMTIREVYPDFEE